MGRDLHVSGHYQHATAATPAQKEVVVPTYRMPRTAEGKVRFPSRSDGIEAAVINGPVGTAKLRIDN